MKILLIHTHYQFKGGEDAVFAQEFELLRQNIPVNYFIFNNHPGWRGALQFISSIWNISVAHKLTKAIKVHQPNCIHIHNWHFATGPIIIRTAKKMGVPVILTLHNYRLLCPSATLIHNGTLFTSSLQVGFPWVAVKHKVYRNSTLQTFWLAFVVWFHKQIGTWNMVDRYLVLTKFSRNIYDHSFFGVSSKKLIVKPNFVGDPGECIVKRGESFLFVGRLSHEKGLMLLLKVFSESSYFLEIAGDGPLKNEVIKASATYNNIKYLGILDKSNVAKALSVCTALVFPSICYETFGLVIIEAFSLGCPVIASNIGAPSELVLTGENGLHFEVGNPSALAQSLHYWHNLSENVKAVFRQNARLSYEANYTPKKNLDHLLAIYQQVIDENKTS